MHTPSRVSVSVLIDPLVAADTAQQILRLLRARLDEAIAIVPIAADDDITVAVSRALAARPCRAVIAVGGDATFDATASALLDSTTALGIVPACGPSHVARQLGIGTDVVAACDIIAARLQAPVELTARRVDAMEVRGGLAVTQIVVGRLATLGEPPPGGVLTQLRWALGAVFRVAGSTARFEIATDGVIRRLRASTVVIANTGAVGIAGAQWGRGIAPDDGVVDVMVIRSSTLLDHLVLAWSALFGRERPRQIIHLRARDSISLRCARPQPLHVDGVIGHGSELDVRVIGGGLHLMLPFDAFATASARADDVAPVGPVALAEACAS